MRILFCDDDPQISAQLHKLVMSYFQQINAKPPECAIYESGDALLKYEMRADIAFLDVEMPGTSGIYVGAKLKEQNPYIKIIIVTSYPDYLDEAMRFQVFRYLSKPIDKNRLYRNLKDALYQYNMDTKEYPIVTALGVFTRRAEEIVCVETSQRKTLVYTTDQVFVSTESIESWKHILTLPCFFVPYRSYIINMRFVRSILKDRIILKYQSKEKCAYLARRKYTDFKNAYLLYLESVK